MTEPIAPNPACIPEDIIHGLFDIQEQPTTDDERWAEITEEYAPFIRRALVTAVRMQAAAVMNAGDAYRKGIADTIAYLSRLQTSAAVLKDIAAIDTVYFARHAAAEATSGGRPSTRHGL